MKLDRLKQFLLSFFISLGLISCSSSVKVIDGSTKKPVAGAVISLRSAVELPFFFKFYSDRAVSDNSGHAVIKTKGTTPRQLIIIKDGYHPYILEANRIQIDPTIELCKFDNPSDLDVVDRSVFIDHPENTISQRSGAPYQLQGITETGLIHVPNESSANASDNRGSFKLPLTIPNGPPEAQAEFAVKFKVRPGNRVGSDIASISVVDGKIESHGNNVYLFNCLRSVNPTKDSVDLAGRTTYTFGTKRGVYGKIYIHTTHGIASSAGLRVAINMGYVANSVNELELKSTYDGVQLNTEEQILAEIRKSGSSDIF